MELKARPSELVGILEFETISGSKLYLTYRTIQPVSNSLYNRDFSFLVIHSKNRTQKGPAVTVVAAWTEEYHFTDTITGRARALQKTRYHQ